MEKSFLIRKEELEFIVAALEFYLDEMAASEGEVNEEYDKDLIVMRELLADLKSEYDDYDN